MEKMTKRIDWPMSFSGSILESDLAEYEKAGIHYMEMCAPGTGAWKELDFIHRAHRYLARASAYDVTIRSIHLPFYATEVRLDFDASSPDFRVRDWVCATQSELIRAAGDAGIPIAVIHPSNGRLPLDTHPQKLRDVLDPLGKLALVAKEAGITLAVENMVRTGVTYVKEEMLHILNAIPDLRVCFDTNHSLVQPNPEYIRAVGERIVALHVSDYDLVNERHLPAGMGKNPWEEILTALEEAKYSGTFNYEVTRKHPLIGREVSLEEICATHRWLMGQGEWPESLPKTVEFPQE